ncbi:MAG: hypothetical protein ACLQFR_04770 [Streptosporangiaceae bacterium]
MNWLWMNIPLAAVAFAAWAGIPLWMVLRHRHWGPEPASPGGNPELDASLVSVQGNAVVPVEAQAPAFLAWDERLVDIEVPAPV